MGEEVNSVPGVSFHIHTKSHRLPHEPDIVADGWMFIRGYSKEASNGFHTCTTIKLGELTLEQFDLVQRMQRECVLASLTMKGEPLNEVHE